MAFTYGNDALNALAQAVAAEPADLSTKADVTALNATNAVVSTKQTTGLPIALNPSVVTADTTVDPDFPVWVLKADANDVTLTLPPAANVPTRQFTFICADATHVPTIAVDGTTTDVLFIGAIQGPTSFPLPASGYTLLLTALIDPFGLGLNVWLATAVVNIQGNVVERDTSGGDVTQTLPLALTAIGQLFAYKNSGGGGHTFTINPAAGDTIEGAGTGIAIADGKSAVFGTQSGATTNWILLGQALA